MAQVAVVNGWEQAEKRLAKWFKRTHKGALRLMVEWVRFQRGAYRFCISYQAYDAAADRLATRLYFVGVVATGAKAGTVVVEK